MAENEDGSEEFEEPYSPVPLWGMTEEEEDDILFEAGFDVEETRDEWNEAVEQSNPKVREEKGIRLLDKKTFVDSLVSLEQDLKDGVLPENTRAAVLALQYARKFIHVYQNLSPIPTALIPLAYRRKDFQKSSIRMSHLIPEGYVRRSMKIDAATELMEKNFGELIEVVAKELVNGFMKIGLWKYERGEAYFSVDDSVGGCTVWMKAEEWERVEG